VKRQTHSWCVRSQERSQSLRYQFRNCDHLNTHLAERRGVKKFLRRDPMIAHRSYLRPANVIFWNVEGCGGIAYRRPRRSMSIQVKSVVFTPVDDIRSHANSWAPRNCGGATSISVGCDDCCLTLVVARSGPREADTIGIRPVLPPARKWQRIRNMCDDR
jgi:hypothetical protein